MKKSWLFLLLTLVLAIQLIVLSSFSNVSERASVTGTSGVVVGKLNYVSLRVTFTVFAEPGHRALIIFPNGTQQEITTYTVFEVFLPKTEAEPFYGQLSFSMSRDSADIFVSNDEPMDVAIASNVDESFFSDEVGPDPRGEVVIYWFKIQGNAEVRVTAYGVTI